ncbi:UDP-3-O-(3-hydroxymyristoyl)glucosamine N-acyltransferase [Prochlorococcus sp. MIT 1341]|uniref:UDP-3-O-(3-hydroxymyristoyl)glucosamine N-acyltransferase n=1 Tax=Prochlorococcus sp. MIT 1341 TaxID=3096221 RepID=UPI002A7570F8|nr:UDP-3-O-(3-hydroxymyristoyl)glucosamine N-acyltransferase [Prochlorococcus sp. MIT 1341]
MFFSSIINILKESEAGLLSYEIGGDPEIISGASIDKGKSQQISFLEKNSKLSTALNVSEVDAILLPNNEDLCLLAKEKGIAWATVKDPRLAFAETLDLLQIKTSPPTGMHPTAVVGEEVVIGENVSIGANVFIGDRSKIGAGSVLHPGTIIYEDVVIGELNELHANVVIHSGCQLGQKCIVNSNAVIGSEGFGFVPTSKGWRKMPQTGSVILEDEVEVGSNSTIDRPCVGETLIGAGTKIDNLVQIGHGVKTGKGCAIASQVGIAGGAQLGNGVILAGQVGVANRAIIGDHVIASSKSGIHGVVSANEVVSGFPAIPNRLWLRCSAAFSKLPEITKTLRELKNKANQ